MSFTAPPQSEIIEKIENFPAYDLLSRRIQRLLTGHAVETEMSRHGSILIPSPLKLYINLKQNIMLVGAREKNLKFVMNLSGKQHETTSFNHPYLSDPNNLPIEIKNISP